MSAVRIGRIAGWISIVAHEPIRGACQSRVASELWPVEHLPACACWWLAAELTRVPPAQISGWLKHHADFEYARTCLVRTKRFIEACFIQALGVLKKGLRPICAAPERCAISTNASTSGQKHGGCSSGRFRLVKCCAGGGLGRSGHW